MAPHSSTLAWKIPWTERPGGLQSMGSLRVGHDWATSLSLFTFMHGEGNGNPLQCSCLENPRDRGAWWASIYGVAQSRTRLKRLSSSSSSRCERVGSGTRWTNSIPKPIHYYLEAASEGRKDPRLEARTWTMYSEGQKGLNHLPSPPRTTLATNF